MANKKKVKEFLALEWKFERLDEIVLISEHKFSVIMSRRRGDVIRELGNRCHAGLLY